MNTKPKYIHDCKTCAFLGHVVINDRDADIYVCIPNKEKPPERVELIWRHSNEDGDYGWGWPDYCTPLSPWHMVALAMYVDHLGANGANSACKGAFFKDQKLVLNLK